MLTDFVIKFAMHGMNNIKVTSKFRSFLHKIYKRRVQPPPDVYNIGIT